MYVIGGKLRALDRVSLNIYRGIHLHHRPFGLRKVHPAQHDRRSGKATGAYPHRGKQIERMNEARWCSWLNNVGFVFQSFNLFAMHTALDNVAMPLMYKAPSSAQALARKMLATWGWNPICHKPSQMSGGQQQRVGIAGLWSPPPRSIRDEPRQLDLKPPREVLRLIRSICRAGTT